MYDYRRMTREERARVNEYRRLRNLPCHSPPHWAMGFSSQYLITAACFEHAQIVGKSTDRLTECEEKLLDACKRHATKIYALVEKWQDWIWSSAAAFVESVGRERAAKIWRDYPILDYGKRWDV